MREAEALMNEDPKPRAKGKASPPSSLPQTYTVALQIKSISLIQPILAIILQIFVIAFIVVSLSIKIYIRRPGSLSDSLHLLYVTGITILATLISSFTSGQIKCLWAFKFARADDDIGSTRRVKQMATLVGLGSTVDSIKYSPISLSLLITGLITTSIVAGLTPTAVGGMHVVFPL